MTTEEMVVFGSIFAFVILVFVGWHVQDRLRLRAIGARLQARGLQKGGERERGGVLAELSSGLPRDPAPSEIKWHARGEVGRRRLVIAEHRRLVTGNRTRTSYTTIASTPLSRDGAPVIVRKSSMMSRLLATTTVPTGDARFDNVWQVFAGSAEDCERALPPHVRATIEPLAGNRTITIGGGYVSIAVPKRLGPSRTGALVDELLTLANAVEPESR